MIEEKKDLIKNIYLYLVSLIALILLIIGFVNLLILALNHFLFKEADKIIVYPIPKPVGSEISEKEWQEQQKVQLEVEKHQRISQKQRQASNAIAMIVVGLVILAIRKKLL